MGREILERINLEFEPENKHEIENLIKEKFEGNENILKSEDNFILVEISNWDLDEDDFNEFKKICKYVSLTKYECLDEEGFIWEKE